jgi:hypothetical protein
MSGTTLNTGPCESSFIHPPFHSVTMSNTVLVVKHIKLNKTQKLSYTLKVLTLWCFGHKPPHL